jgi:hypothetical protein
MLSALEKNMFYLCFLDHSGRQIVNQSDYWNQFYQKFEVTAPSDFAVSISDSLDLFNLHLIDWGCGSGRDGLYLSGFAKKVSLIDSSSEAIRNIQKVLVEKNISNADACVLDISATSDLPFRLNENILHYARFFLHAINDEGLNSFINLISCNSSAGFLHQAAFEYRILDSSQSITYTYGNHSRWLRSPLDITNAMNHRGWNLVSEVIGKNLAVFNEENPTVVRQIFAHD